MASIGETTLWRWLSEDAIRPWSHRTWIFPRDPAFERKAARVLDLYQGKWEGKPLSAADCVISTDEKTSIQARRRIHASLPPAAARPMRVEHEYERRGAWAYLAAWDVRCAKVRGRCETTTGIRPFNRLVAQVMRQQPYRSAPRVFWIMDNGSSHRGQACIRRALGWNENTTAQETTMAGITRHEFTGQEGLDNSGLWMVDMNGRMYQPSGSYFYSPDPHIPDPENTLDYDRYAYVRDNPLTYTDPSGFDATVACNTELGCGSGGGGDNAVTSTQPPVDIRAPQEAPATDSGSLLNFLINPEAGSGGFGQNHPSPLMPTKPLNTPAQQQSNPASPTMLPTVTVSGASESQGSFYNDSAFPALFDQYVTQPALGQFFKVTYRGRPSLQIGSKDAVVLYPAGGLEGQGSANALSVQLAPGPNGLLLTIANIDTSFMGMVMGATGVPVQLAIEIQATTQQGLVQSSFSVTQQISPGNSVFTSIPGLYVGPGQATVIVINRGGYTTAITLQAFPQSAN